MEMNKSWMKGLSKVLLVFGLLSILCAYILKKIKYVLSLQTASPESTHEWIFEGVKKWINKLPFQKRQSQTESFSISDKLSVTFDVISNVLKSILEDFYAVSNAPKVFLQSIGSLEFSFTLLFRRFLVFIVIVVIIFLIVKVTLNLAKSASSSGKKKEKQRVDPDVNNSVMVVDSRSIGVCSCSVEDNHQSYLTKVFIYGTVAAAFISIPWEFFRLYHVEIAKRSALVQSGPPEECNPQNLSVFRYLLTGLKWYFSWSNHDPCEKYYQALLVDPFLEVTPLMVLSSVATRCIIHPLEMLCHGMGKSMKVFFSEIPFQWQPVILFIIFIIVLLLLIMLCSYTIRLPFFFVFKPVTPLQKTSSRTRITKITDDCSHKRKKRLLT